MKAVDAVFGLRVENEDKVQGLDVTGQFQRGYLFGENCSVIYWLTFPPVDIPKGGRAGKEEDYEKN